MRFIERAEKRAATFAIHRVCNNVPRCTAIQSNVPPGTCCEKMHLSGISFRISLGAHCICCIDKGAILIQVSRIERGTIKLDPPKSETRYRAFV